MKNLQTKLVVALLLSLVLTTIAQAQTTAFTYQGKLTTSGTLASGNYDMQFKLFDALTDGNQIGASVTNPTVTVDNGVFTVQLDFGAGAFDGTARFLEICLRPAGNPDPYTILSPRQPFTSIPYASHSTKANAADGLSVACTGCITNTQINTVDGAKITGEIPTASVPEGSGNYIQNSAAALRRGKTSVQQDGGFDINGDGVVGGLLSGSTINAQTQFNLGGVRILSNAGTDNLFAGAAAGAMQSSGFSNSFFGVGAGMANTDGWQNAFFGKSAGAANTFGVDNAFFGSFSGFNSTGNANSFFGTSAGYNTTGDANAFFGRSAGFQNTSGTRNAYFGTQAGRDGSGSSSRDNAFFGYQAGLGNVTFENAFFGANAGRSNFLGSGNAFFGFNAGYSNFVGIENAFFGKDAGYANTDGHSNTFFGVGAGNINTIGIRNTALGYRANVGSSGLFNATAIGYRAMVTASDTMVLGSITGVNGSNNDTNVVIGATSGVARLNVFGGTSWTSNNWVGSLQFRNASAIGWQANAAGWHFGIGQSIDGLYFFKSSVPIGSTATPATFDLIITNGGLVGIGTVAPDAKLSVNGTASKPGGGSWLNFSDERLKTLKHPFTAGLNAILQLQPLRYEYKPDNAMGIDAPGEHIGFSAQAVQKVLPEAVSSNNNGYLLVNNDPIFLAMLNAIKEQQAQIQQQQQQIDALKKLLCQQNPQADICK